MVTAPVCAFVSDQKRIRENDLGTGEPSLPPLAHLIGCPACRAARGLLEWNQQDLAVKAGISQLTVHQPETGATRPRRATLDVVRRAFENAGVDFIKNSRENELARMGCATPCHAFCVELVRGQSQSGACTKGRLLPLYSQVAALLRMTGLVAGRVDDHGFLIA
jgi:transcriptional regulator with XRE-family HTH domain